MPERNDIWVILPTYDGRVMVLACLNDLVPQAAGKARILVVDNGSSDGSEAAVRAHFPDVGILRLFPNRGFTGAVNAGVAEARRRGASIAIVLPNDNAVEHGWLEALLAGVASSPGAAAVTSDTLGEDLDPRFRELDGALNVVGRNVTTGPLIRSQTLPRLLYPCGNGVALRLNAVNIPCDEDYIAYYDDVEQGWRLRLLGHEILLQPAARLRHRGGGTMRRFPFQRIFLAERNRLLTLFTHYGRSSLARLLPILAIDAFLGWLHPRKFRPRLTALGWTLSHWPLILRKRRSIQSVRRVGESVILSLMTSNVVHSFSPGAALINGLSRLDVRVVGLPMGM